MSVTDDLRTAFGPWIYPDIDDTSPASPDLWDYLGALGDMWAQVELFVDDDPWSTLLDPDLCPVLALPYLAQYVGERLPPGLTEAQQRQWIKDAPNQKRGTLLSLARAAQRSLIGPGLVAIFERSDGTTGDHPDDIVVQTFTNQTPDPERVEYDIYSVLPADIVLHYSVIPGQTWQIVSGTYTTWTAVMNAFPTWGDVRSAQSGAHIFTKS